MVHALEETHRVLRPGGGLIDLRPATTNRTLELDLAGARLFIGEIDSSVTFADHRVADAALISFVNQDRLEAEHDAEFQLTTDIDTFDDLREFATTLRRSILREEHLAQIQSLIEDNQDFIIHSRRDMIIRRYRRKENKDRVL